MNQILKIIAYGILSLPMILTHHAAQSIWGSGLVGFTAFVLLYILDFWIAAIVHELGHALAAYWLGWRIAYIAVFPVAYYFGTKKFSVWARSSGDLGGVVSIVDRPRDSRVKVAFLFAAGPIFNLLLAAIAIGAASASSPQFANIIGTVAMMSLFLGVGNLLPWRTRNGMKSDGAVLVSLAIRRSRISKRKTA